MKIFNSTSSADAHIYFINIWLFGSEIYKTWGARDGLEQELILLYLMETKRFKMLYKLPN